MSSNPAELDSVKLDLLRRAVEIYLEKSYPNGELPPSVRRRLEWAEGATPAHVLGQPPFERANRPTADAPMVLALRLGNALYPHMKLQVQPWPNSDGFLLSVNTHDQILGLDPSAPDIEAFRLLQAENQRIKEEIEQAWDAVGLPTFLGYLRRFIEDQPEPSGE